MNGLTIGGRSDDLAGYFQRELIKGPDAFVEEAHGFQDFEQAMKRKLVRELHTVFISQTQPSESTGDG